MTRFSSCFATLAMMFGAAATAAAQIQLPVPLRAASTGDITALLDARTIEAEVHGSGIRSVTVRLRRLVPGPVTVRVPVGSYFLSRDRAAQNMVATVPAARVLDTDAWVTLAVNAACANRARRTPAVRDRFAIQRRPPQAELTRVLLRLRSEGAPHSTGQAAVWIITDDADYDDLGALVSEARTRGSVSRRIREAESAEAMRLVALAGVAIERKAIWRDRERIFWRVNEGPSRAWLRSADTVLARREAEAVERVADRLAGAGREFRILARSRLRVFIGVGSQTRAAQATGLAAFLRARGHEVDVGALDAGTSRLVVRFRERLEPAARELGEILTILFGEPPLVEALGRGAPSTDWQILVGAW